MKTDTGAKPGLLDAERGAGGGGGKTEIPNPLLGAIPPGALPQINLEAAGRSGDAEPFLAPAPQGRRAILGYGHARVGRVLPHGGSPSSGPLTGVPLRALRPPPVPPSYRRQALEPGHQEPDSFRMIRPIEADPRAPGEALAEGLDRLERSAAAVRSVRGARRGGGGRHEPVASAAGPAGTGGAQVAASLGVPAAESVRTSDRGVYVAGRASGARWEADASVKPRGAGGADPCVAAAKRERPLTPLQSVKRYAQQQAALKDTGHDASGPGARAPTDIRPGADSVARYASKAVSPAFKAFGKARMPGPVTAKEMTGRQEDPTPRLDAEQERRLLALRAEVSGLAGRFGARPRCLMDMTEALRPAPGPAEWRREREPMRTEAGGRAGGAPSDAKTSQGLARRSDGGPDAAELRGDGACAVPQKYPARAGVAMRDSSAADASEAAPPDGPGPAQADEGIPTGRQAPFGQEAYPPQNGADARARDEAGPGAAGGAGPSGAAVIRRPEIAAQGMGGPSTPVLLGIDRAFRQEANARIDAQNAARALRTAFENAGNAAKQAMESARLVLKNAPFSAEMKLAAQRLPPAEAARFVLARLREFGEQARKADEERLLATFLLSLVGEAAKQAAGRNEELRRQETEIRERGRALGNMDDATLRRRALEAAHRAERDSYRAERRAFRRARGGVFMTRQFAEVAVASERAFDHEKRSARHQAEAARAKKGSSAQARAQREADYHGSLAEAERHRASVARSHILGPEIAKAKGVKELLAAERARSDQFYRDQRELAELNRFRAVQEPKLHRVDAQIEVLAEKNPDGSPKKVDGKYVARRGRDQYKIDRLQREQDRLVARISRKLGSPGGVPGARTWEEIRNLWLSTAQLAAAQPSGAFAGRPEGHLIAVLREPGLPPNIRVLVEAQVNSMMSEVIADASARSEAAFQAGMDAGLAQYDPKLNDAQRKEAAASHAAAVVAAAQDVAEIEDAIATKRENGAYFESGWGEYDEDQKKLEEAKKRLAALLDVCNNHPACADAKRDCEAQSDEKQTCKLGPPAGGGTEEGEEEDEDGGAAAGGEGTSISAVDASAPEGGGAAAPQGGKEIDGKDEPEDEKEEAGNEPEDEKAVEPSEAQPDERPTVVTEAKEPEKEKKQEPKLPPPDTKAWRPFGKLFERIGGLVESFAGSVVEAARRIGVSIAHAGPPPTDEIAAKAKSTDLRKWTRELESLEEELDAQLESIDEALEDVEGTLRDLDAMWPRAIEEKDFHADKVRNYLRELHRMLSVLRARTRSDLEDVEAVLHIYQQAQAGKLWLGGTEFADAAITPEVLRRLADRVERHFGRDEHESRFIPSGQGGGVVIRPKSVADELHTSLESIAGSYAALASVLGGVQFWMHLYNPHTPGISVPKSHDLDSWSQWIDARTIRPRSNLEEQGTVTKKWDRIWGELNWYLDGFMEKLSDAFPTRARETYRERDWGALFVLREHLERFSYWIGGGFTIIQPTGLLKVARGAEDELEPLAVYGGLYQFAKSLPELSQVLTRRGRQMLAAWARRGARPRTIYEIPKITGPAAAHPEVVSALENAERYLATASRNFGHWTKYIKEVERAVSAAHWIDRGFDVVASEVKLITKSGVRSRVDLIIRDPVTRKLYAVEVKASEIGKWDLSRPGQEAARSAVAGGEDLFVRSEKLKRAGYERGETIPFEDYLVQRYEVAPTGTLRLSGVDASRNVVAPVGSR